MFLYFIHLFFAIKNVHYKIFVEYLLWLFFIGSLQPDIQAYYKKNEIEENYFSQKNSDKKKKGNKSPEDKDLSYDVCIFFIYDNP